MRYVSFLAESGTELSSQKDQSEGTSSNYTKGISNSQNWDQLDPTVLPMPVTSKPPSPPSTKIQQAPTPFSQNSTVTFSPPPKPIRRLMSSPGTAFTTLTNTISAASTPLAPSPSTIPIQASSLSSLHPQIMSAQPLLISSSS